MAKKRRVKKRDRVRVKVQPPSRATNIFQNRICIVTLSGNAINLRSVIEKAPLSTSVLMAPREVQDPKDNPNNDALASHSQKAPNNRYVYVKPS